MANLSAGKLRHYITVSTPSQSTDSDGSPLNTGETLCLCWASITALTSKELFAVGGFSSQVTHKVAIRYPAVSIVAGNQVTCDGQTLKVQAVSDPDGMRRELDLFCLDSTAKEITPNG